MATARQVNAADVDAQADQAIVARLRRWEEAMARIHASGIGKARFRDMIKASVGDGTRQETERAVSAARAQLATVEELLRQGVEHAKRLRVLRKSAPKWFWFREYVGKTARVHEAYLKYVRYLVQSASAVHDTLAQRLDAMKVKMVFVDGERIASEPGDFEVGGVALLLKEQAEVVPAVTAMFIAVFRDCRRWPPNANALRESLVRLNTIDRPASKRPTPLAREEERVAKAMKRFKRRLPAHVPVVRVHVKTSFP